MPDQATQLPLTRSDGIGNNPLPSPLRSSVFLLDYDTKLTSCGLVKIAHTAKLPTHDSLASFIGAAVCAAVCPRKAFDVETGRYRGLFPPE